MLSRMLSLKETAFLENYSYNLRDALYQTVSKADWEKLAASRQTDTITLFTAQCNQVSYGVADIIHLFASLVSALVQLCIAIWLSLPVTIFVIICGGVFILAFKKMFRISKEYGDELIKINRSMYSELINQLRSVKEVRTYNVQKEHAALFENISDSFRQAKIYPAACRAPSDLFLRSGVHDRDHFRGERADFQNGYGAADGAGVCVHAAVARFQRGIRPNPEHSDQRSGLRKTEGSHG